MEQLNYLYKETLYKTIVEKTDGTLKCVKMEIGIYLQNLDKHYDQ